MPRDGMLEEEDSIMAASPPRQSNGEVIVQISAQEQRLKSMLVANAIPTAGVAGGA